MKLCRLIEIYLKYDNMHTFGIINAFICINNHVNLCINGMLSVEQGVRNIKLMERPPLIHCQDKIICIELRRTTREKVSL